MTEWSRIVLRQTIQHHSTRSLFPKHWCRKSWCWLVLWRPTTSSRTKRCPCHHRGLECKSGSQEIPGIIDKFGFVVQNEAEQRLTVLSKEHTGHSKHPLPAIQETTVHMDITRWSIPKQTTFSAVEVRNALYHQQQDLELTVAQIMSSLLQNSGLKLKKSRR